MPDRARLLVLNVDDDEAGRYTKSRALRAAGEIELIEAATGAEALRLVAERRPTLVLLDVKLPDIDGFEVCRRIKRDHPDTLVLQISASFVSGAHRTRGLHAGADSYLTQPIEPDELLATVRALLRIRRAESALRESEERLRLVVEGATDYAIITTDPEGRITGWSPGAEAIFRWGAADVVGEGFALVFTPEDREAGVPGHELATALRDGLALDERWHIRRGGALAFMNGTVRPLHDPNGRHRGFLKIARDETGRRHAAEALNASESRLSSVLESVSDGFFAVDSSWRFTLFNAAAERFYGRPRAEVLGRRIWDVFPALVGTVFESGCREVMAGGGPVRFEARSAVRPDRSVEKRAAPVPGGGIAVSFSDITERKAAEERLREVNANLEARVEERTRERDRAWRLSPDLHAVAAMDGTLEAVNAAWTALLGWSEGDLVGRPFHDLAHPDDLAATLKTFAGIVEAPLTTPYEYRLRHRDGTWRWFAWIGRFEDGRVYATGRHVTEERAQREALREAEDALRQAQKMEAVGQLTGGIAHDFNNLLQIVTGNLEMLGRNLPADAPRLRRAADNAMNGATRAATLTSRLLAFSRRQPLAPRPVDVNGLVAGMHDLLKRALGETIALHAALAPDLWLTEADPNQLENALLNLAVNARDAMPEGGRLTIATRNVEVGEGGEVPSGAYVAIAVEDDGAGMDRETLQRAFEPFFTTKEVGKGTGLGLSMVYGFVRQSGGHVGIASEPGRGATVTIHLPRLVGAREAEPEAGERDAPAAAGAETVLVVEDDDDVRAYTVEALRELGYGVIEAEDGPSALRTIEQPDAGRISLLFTDVVLPGGMNGEQLAERVREVRPDLKVLFTTGYARDAIVHDGRLDPGIRLITKPFTFADLAVKVRDLLDDGPA